MLNTISIADLDLSLRLRNSLQRAGYRFVADIITLNINEIKKINGLGITGQNELINFFELLQTGKIRFIDDNIKDHNKNIESNRHNDEKILSENLKLESKFLIENINMSTRLMNSLTSLGVKDIRETFSWSEIQIFAIPNIGKKTLDELATLKHQFLEYGEIANSEQQFTIQENSIIQIPQLANEINKNIVQCTHQAYLDFLELIDEKNSEVLKKRICFRIEDDQMSLEEIATKLGCTRERVRQIEQKSLNLMVKFFCQQGVIKSKDKVNFFRLNHKLSTYWLKLVEDFAQIDEPSIEEFISTILQSWQISAQQLKDVLPFFITIFTNSTSRGLIKELKHLNLSHFEFIKHEEKVAYIKLKKLRLGKHCSDLEEEGIFSLGDFDKIWSSPQRSIAYKSSERFISEFLTAACSKNEINWKAYLQAININHDHGEILFDLEHPFTTLTNALRKIIPFITTWKFCIEIFDKWIIPSNRNGLTMAKVAKELWGKDSLGPSVARLELYTLRKLNDVLVQRDFSHCPIYIPQELLDLFKELTELHEVSEGNFLEFEKLIRIRRSLAKPHFEDFSYISFSIINCKSADRRKFKVKVIKNSDIQPEGRTLNRIKEPVNKFV